MTRKGNSNRRGQMIQRRPGVWLLRVYLGRNTQGKKQYSSRSFKGTTAEARRELTAMHRNLDTKTFVRPGKLTVAEYLTKWIEGKIDVSPGTRVSYKRLLNSYIIPAIGERRLHELSTGEIQQLVTDLDSKGGADGKGLSPRTVEYTHRVLHTALEDALRQTLLVRNPADYVTLPKKTRRNPAVLSPEQMNKLFAATKENPLNPLWRLLLTTGLRPQEALALKWTDVDFEELWLSVNRTLVDDGKGKQTLSDSTKADSKRRVGLPESTVESLRAHKKRQNEMILGSGPRFKNQGLIFTNRVGHPMDHNAVRREWKKALEAAGLPSIRLYDARHSHLTALLADGADLAWIAARAGHKDIKMTQQHYAHVLPEVHRKMGEMTERLLQNGGKKNVVR